MGNNIANRSLISNKCLYDNLPGNNILYVFGQWLRQISPLSHYDIGGQPPAPSAKLIYEDDFSDPNSGWHRASYERYEIGYEDGEYYTLLKYYDWSACVWNRNARYFTDFALEVNARLVSGPEGSCYGVIFRLQDGDNFYRFLVCGDGWYVVETGTEGMWTRLHLRTKSAFVNQGNSTNHLKVVCLGSQIEVYVKGHHLATVTDDSFPRGYVGVIADAAERNVKVAFDNIEVYRLD